jgi:transcriptional antiterminator NusG
MAKTKNKKNSKEQIAEEQLATSAAADEDTTVEAADAATEDVEPNAEYQEEVVEKVDDGRAWYIVQCYTGQEKKVEIRLQQLVEEKKLKKKIFKVLIPEEETIEVKNNKRIEKMSKIYPGYVFVQMLLDDNIYYEIKKITGVSKFIGPNNRPVPVTEEEILKVLRKIGDKTKKIDVDFEEGEMVKVISGPFRGYSGPIAEIHFDRGTLKALISIFGRETPVKLDFNQVEKLIK